MSAHGWGYFCRIGLKSLLLYSQILDFAMICRMKSVLNSVNVSAENPMLYLIISVYYNSRIQSVEKNHKSLGQYKQS